VPSTDSNMARDAFAVFTSLSTNSEAHAKIIFDFFDLLSSLAAHSKRNGLTGQILARLAGWWAFGHSDPGLTFEMNYQAWSKYEPETRSFIRSFPANVHRVADASNHLFFAYLRSLSPVPVPVIPSLPHSLQDLLESTEYPPPPSTFQLLPAAHVLLTVDKPSPTLFAILCRAKRFQRHDDPYGYDLLPTIFDIGGEDPIMKDYKRIFQSIMALENPSLSSLPSGDVTSSISSFSLDDPILSPPTYYNIGPTLPTLLANSAPDYGQRSSIESVHPFELDDAFWWVWITSLAAEEPPSRRAVFGRCLMVPTDNARSGWLLVEEQVEKARSMLPATTEMKKNRWGGWRGRRRKE
jgi:hypothetical protein